MAAAETNVPLEPEDLNPTDRAILDELQEGRSTPAYIADKHGYTAGNVRNRMTSLSKHDHVEGLGGGMYELVDDPRSGKSRGGGGVERGGGGPDLTAVRRAIDDAEAAAERGDGSALQDALERAREAINDE